MRISAAKAKSIYGISAVHEEMPNGEIRFRLTPADGNGYIRTHCGPNGGWQMAHFHHRLRETYVVEQGWIACATRLRDQIVIHRHMAGSIFTTEPAEVHNIYMSANSIIHTLKHQGTHASDWHVDEDMTLATQALAEDAILALAAHPAEADDRFGSYVEIYNNLDKLIWSVPNFLAAGATLIVAFFASAVSRSPDVIVASWVYALVYFFCSVLYCLGYSSLSRLREHHTILGNYLATLEPDRGYFTLRAKTVARRWPLAAPDLFRIVYAALSAGLLLAAIGNALEIEIIDAPVVRVPGPATSTAR